MNGFTLLVLQNPTARYLSALERLPDSTRIVAGESEEILLPAAAEADALLCGGTHRELLRALWPRLSRLRWIHALAAGLDGLLFPELVQSPIPLTNSRGVFAPSLGEFAIASMLWFAKDLNRMMRLKQGSKWESMDVEMLQGKTLVIVGYGAIGRESARRARAFGMHVIAVRSNPRSDEFAPEVIPVSRLAEVLPRADYLLVSAPLTPATRGMIGGAQLRLLKPSSVVINLGRGPVIVEADLVRALEENMIRGAALDVFDVEPLPPGHPFWKLENVLVSPHSADHVEGWMESAMDLFVRNFERFAASQPLENIAAKEKGY